MLMMHTTEELAKWVLSHFLDYQSLAFQTNSKGIWNSAVGDGVGWALALGLRWTLTEVLNQGEVQSNAWECFGAWGKSSGFDPGRVTGTGRVRAELYSPCVKQTQVVPTALKEKHYRPASSQWKNMRGCSSISELIVGQILTWRVYFQGEST